MKARVIETISPIRNLRRAIRMQTTKRKGVINK